MPIANPTNTDIFSLYTAHLQTSDWQCLVPQPVANPHLPTNKCNSAEEQTHEPQILSSSLILLPALKFLHSKMISIGELAYTPTNINCLHLPLASLAFKNWLSLTHFIYMIPFAHSHRNISVSGTDTADLSATHLLLIHSFVVKRHFLGGF